MTYHITCDIIYLTKYDIKYIPIYIYMKGWDFMRDMKITNGKVFDERMKSEKNRNEKK